MRKPCWERSCRWSWRAGRSCSLLGPRTWCLACLLAVVVAVGIAAQRIALAVAVAHCILVLPVAASQPASYESPASWRVSTWLFLSLRLAASLLQQRTSMMSISRSTPTERVQLGSTLVYMYRLAMAPRSGRRLQIKAGPRQWSALQTPPTLGSLQACQTTTRQQRPRSCETPKVSLADQLSSRMEEVQACRVARCGESC